MCDGGSAAAPITDSTCRPASCAPRPRRFHTSTATASSSARAQPTNGKVTLLGYSVGGQFVARTLYTAKPGGQAPRAERPLIAKIDRVVFLDSFFNTPTEETPPPTNIATFPLHVFDAAGSAAVWGMTQERDAACTGHVVPGSKEQLWAQVLEQDTVGREWGGNDPAHPVGLSRSPTFSSYGWNTAAAGQLTTPTLVIHGLEDRAAPPVWSSDIYNALPASMTNKVLVQVGCASHGLLLEGCSGARCTPPSGTPHGGTPGQPWAGPTPRSRRR